MSKIAITGNIGSGKTSALAFFKKKKYLTISSDEIIREIYADKELRAKILAKLGIKDDNYKKKIINGMQDRNFNYNLKKTLYPLMNRLRNKKALKNISLRNIFFEVPLLFEEKQASNYDTIVFIKSDYNKRLSRVLKKGMSREYFELMNQYQHSNRLKEIHSDITILNNGSLLDFYESLSWCETSL